MYNPASTFQKSQPGITDVPSSVVPGMQSLKMVVVEPGLFLGVVVVYSERAAVCFYSEQQSCGLFLGDAAGQAVECDWLSCSLLRLITDHCEEMSSRFSHPPQRASTSTAIPFFEKDSNWIRETRLGSTVLMVQP